ncbi:S8 family peptidase [Agromyces ramosus]|uniref:S8 family peptidase n=1 Tax=Agromyces ramosus TaxID=33879 RepID=UPI0027D84290|nr:S8 family serine peptidase [Agromyces ramosus]
MRPIWRSTITAATVAVLAATASPSVAVEQGDAGDTPPIVGSAAWLGKPADRPVTVTLVNGDRVLVTNGTTVTMLPRHDGSQPLVETRRVGDDVYVYPADAAAALSAGKVDEELFNVTGLVRQGYDDANSSTIPLIAQYADPATPTVAPRGAETGVVLESIGSVALNEDKANASAFWADLTDPRSRAAGSIEKIWLDRKVEATLDQSTAQVNAPDAWSAGFDGAGATVAILDTGADAEHPDLQGRIIAGEDFTGFGSWNDGNGHGTHVASTVGGSGRASDGANQGVAPRADLLVGKVLTDGGSGSTSGIIAGMEWAVAQGADVVSMSLGSTGPVDGCVDPMAMATQSLSETSDSLFVIAAGNDGPADNTVSTPGCAPAALTVGAVDRDDTTALFSSRGPVAGTHVLKPEITAPGVGISAAATGGRGVYAYRSMSGTSMATPHVAGAAAIVKQRHPEWTGEQIKAALVSSAETDIPGDVRETGGGLLDVSTAINQTVTGSPALQAGTFDWPHAGDEAVTIEVPYTNASDQPVTLQLEVAGVTGNDGSRVKSKIATLGRKAITIAPGATATVPLRINPAATLAAAQYGDVSGRILATGGATVSTPFSLYVQPETVRVTIKMIDRNGQPAAGASSVDIVNTDTSTGNRWYNDGSAEQVADVRPGRYFVSSFVATPDRAGNAPLVESVSYVARPELSVSKDVTLVLDARDADPITVKTDRRSETRSTTLSFVRSWDDVWGHSGTVTMGPTVRSIYADATGQGPRRRVRVRALLAQVRAAHRGPVSGRRRHPAPHPRELLLPQPRRNRPAARRRCGHGHERRARRRRRCRQDRDHPHRRRHQLGGRPALRRPAGRRHGGPAVSRGERALAAPRGHAGRRAAGVRDPVRRSGRAHRAARRRPGRAALDRDRIESVRLQPRIHAAHALHRSPRIRRSRPQARAHRGDVPGDGSGDRLHRPARGTGLVGQRHRHRPVRAGARTLAAHRALLGRRYPLAGRRPRLLPLGRSDGRPGAKLRARQRAHRHVVRRCHLTRSGGVLHRRGAAGR